MAGDRLRVGAADFKVRHYPLAGEPADNPERAILNRFLMSIGPVGSVPVKPVRQILRILPSTPHSQPRTPTARCAYALVASASASGQLLAPAVRLPRSFQYGGVDAIIENGVARDILKAGMAELIANDNPAVEAFELSAKHITTLEDLIGREALIKRGLI